MKTWIWLVILAVIVIVGGVGFFVWNNINNQQTTTTSSTAVMDPASIPVSTTTTNVGEPPPDTQTASAPLAVTDPTASTTKTTASVSGNVTPNGAKTTYWYEYGTASSLGQKTKIQKIGSGNQPLVAQATIKGLTANTSYYFQLDASNSFGTTTGSVEQFTTNEKPAPVGDVPTVDTVGGVSVGQMKASLVGTVIPNRSKTIYWFEYGTTPDMGSVTHLKSVGTATKTKQSGVEADLLGLQPGTTYYFRLDANNAYGTTLGNILTFTTLK